MSSNIKVQRICQLCGKEFTAKTTVTGYCSDDCRKKAYKLRIRDKKVEISNEETHKTRNKVWEDLQAKDFLTITETCQLVSMSRWTIWRAIRNEELNAAKIGRRTLIRRQDLEVLFDPSSGGKTHTKEGDRKSPPKPSLSMIDFDITNSYTLTEVQEKYRISESALQNLIKRNNIPKIKKGWYAYVPKEIIDNLLS